MSPGRFPRLIQFIYHQSVLRRNQGYSSAEGRSSTANSGTKATVLPVMNRYVASRCSPHPTLSLASQETLKDLKKRKGHQSGGEGSGFGKMGPPNFTEIDHKN